VRLLDQFKELLESGGSQSAAPRSGKDDREHALQIAAAVLLLEMEHADHEYDPAERDEIRGELRRYFDLTHDEVEALIAAAEPEARDAVSLRRFLRTLNEYLAPADKQELLVMLWRVAFADRRLDADEEHLLRQLAELLHMPHREFIKARHAVTGE